MSVQYNQFKQIVCTCNYSNTYKMAWAKALVDLSKRLPLDDGLIQVSLEQIARQFIIYYWNQTLFFDFIQSAAENKTPAIITVIKSLIEKYYHHSSNRIAITFDDAETNLDQQIYEKAIKDVVAILKKDVSYRFLYIDRERMPLYQYDKGDNYILISSSLLKELKNDSFYLTQLINYRWGKIIEAWNSSPKLSKKVFIKEQDLNNKEDVEKYSHWIDILSTDSLEDMSLNLNDEGVNNMTLNKELSLLSELEEKYNDNLSDSEIAADYADQLFRCFEEQLIDTENAYNPLVSINTRFPRIERVNEYLSKVLTPSTSDTIEELVTSMGVLNKSFYSNPKNEIIAESYAITLSLYAEKNQDSDISEPLNKLAELINLFPDNELIDEKYHSVLDMQEDSTIIPMQYITPKVKAKKVKHLTENQAVGYAETLCNLSKEQEVSADVIETCSKLNKLCNNYPTNKGIAVFYADALYNMISFIDDGMAEKTLTTIEQLYELHDDSEEIAEIFVNAIEEAIDFSKEGCHYYLVIIEAIASRFDANQSILDSYAYALYTQIKTKNNPPKLKKDAREKLLDLCNQHPDNNDIQAYYSDCYK